MPVADTQHPWRRATLAAFSIVTATVFLGWWALEDTIWPPAMEDPVHGVTYVPYGENQDAVAFDGARAFDARASAKVVLARNAPRKEQIETDMRTLAAKVRYVRTYSACDGAEDVPRIANQYGLRVVAGARIYDHAMVPGLGTRAWLDFNERQTGREIAGLIRIANDNPNVERVLVGNERLLYGEISPRRLLDYIRQVKKNVKVPVSTAEPWHIWLEYPELAREVDFIAVHILPYWDASVGKNGPIAYLKTRIAELRAVFPNKTIVIAEFGWPSGGPNRVGWDAGGSALNIASHSEQARIVREAVAWLREQKIDHFIAEAFDQPWRSRDLEGTAGGYWGLWDADRQLKFAWTGPVTVFGTWWKLALGTVMLTLPVFAIFMWVTDCRRFVDQLVVGLVLALAVAGMIFTACVGPSWD